MFIKTYTDQNEKKTETLALVQPMTETRWPMRVRVENPPPQKMIFCGGFSQLSVSMGT